MMRYSCDACGRNIDPQDELRYSVKIDVRAEVEPPANEDEDDRDHLEELQEALVRLEDSSLDPGELVGRQLQFDLCSDCCRKFVKRPLGREGAKLCNFSKN